MKETLSRPFNILIFRDTKQAIKNSTTSIGGIGISIGAGLLPVLIDNAFTNNHVKGVYR